MCKDAIINIIALNEEELNYCKNVAKELKNVYYTYSIFPGRANDFNKEDFENTIIENMKDPKFSGIGETGLDFIDNTDDFSVQEEVFVQIIKCALKYNLSLNIHARNSLDKVIEILETFEKLPKTILHCFDGKSNQLQKILDLGCYVSFNGLITYNDRNKDLIKAIKENPRVERFILETDAPYLAPTIHRGKNNYPKYLHLVSERIAKELNLNKKLLHEQLNLNALAIYNFKV